MKRFCFLLGIPGSKGAMGLQGTPGFPGLWGLVLFLVFCFFSSLCQSEHFFGISDNFFGILQFDGMTKLSTVCISC